MNRQGRGSLDKLGVKVELIADGYIISSPTGQMKIIGADLADVTFSQVGLGCVNITRVEKAIASGTLPYDKMCLVMTKETIKTFMQNRDIDVVRLKEILTTDRQFYNKPCLAVLSPDHGHYFIDGNHRMAAHIIMRDFEILADVVAQADLEPYLIRMWLNGRAYVENEEDIRATFGKHMDSTGKPRE